MHDFWCDELRLPVVAAAVHHPMINGGEVSDRDVLFGSGDQRLDRTNRVKSFDGFAK